MNSTGSPGTGGNETSGNSTNGATVVWPMVDDARRPSPATSALPPASVTRNTPLGCSTVSPGAVGAPWGSGNHCAPVAAPSGPSVGVSGGSGKTLASSSTRARRRPSSWGMARRLAIGSPNHDSSSRTDVLPSTSTTIPATSPSARTSSTRSISRPPESFDAATVGAPVNEPGTCTWSIILRPLPRIAANETDSRSGVVVRQAPSADNLGLSTSSWRSDFRVAASWSWLGPRHAATGPRCRKPGEA